MWQLFFQFTLINRAKSWKNAIRLFLLCFLKCQQVSILTCRLFCRSKWLKESHCGWYALFKGVCVCCGFFVGVFFFSFLLSFCIIVAVWPYFQIQLNSNELSWSSVYSCTFNCIHLPVTQGSEADRREIRKEGRKKPLLIIKPKSCRFCLNLYLTMKWSSWDLKSLLCECAGERAAPT